MGLNCSHGAFDGAYSRFDRFRYAVCLAMGGQWVSHADSYWYWGDGYGPETHPGLQVFLTHSDCDGSMTPKECRQVASDLEALVPKLALVPLYVKGERPFDFVEMAETFIAGCRLAASKQQKLKFR